MSGISSTAPNVSALGELFALYTAHMMPGQMNVFALGFLQKI